MNDPKQTSLWAQTYFEQEGINWWYTLTSSPDLNPNELIWGVPETVPAYSCQTQTIKSGSSKNFGKLSPQLFAESTSVI